MKFIVSSHVLSKELGIISGVISNNNPIAILDNFLLEITDNKLKITASDSETTISVMVDVEEAEDGKITVPSKMLMDILKTFPEQPLSFKVNLEEKKLDIVDDKGNYSTSIEDADAYPTAPTLESDFSIQLDGDIIARSIGKTIFATSTDDLRPIMTGVYFHFAADKSVIVATDAHKLVKYSREDITSDEEVSFIMPKKPLNILSRSVEGKQVEITYNDTNAKFKYNNIEMVCRLIGGSYPNYEAVIPKDNPYKLLLDRSLLLNTLRRVSLFANKGTNQIKMQLAGQELTIMAEDADFSNAAQERIACSYDGDDMVIGFNSKFLIEMLNNLECDEVVILLSGPAKAGVLSPSTPIDEGEEIKMLLMPLHVS